MAQAALTAVNELTRMLQSDTGLPAAVADISTELPPVCVSDIVAGHSAADLLDKTNYVKYPFFVFTAIGRSTSSPKSFGHSRGRRNSSSRFESHTSTSKSCTAN